MPVVPDTDFVPKFNPNMEVPHVEGLPYNTTRATPEMFGGQVGATLQQAGDMLEKHAIQRQQIINESTVNDLYANQFAPSFRDMYNKFYQLRGKDAESQFNDYSARMNDLRSTFRDQLANPMQQKMFDTISRQRMNYELDGMARHAADQTRAWNLETSDNLLGSFVQDGVDKYNDPKQLQRNENSILVETSAYGAGSWNPDGSPGPYGPTGAGQATTVINMRAQHYIDQMYKGAIERQLQANPQGGIALYDQYKSKLSGPMQSELEKVIKPIQELGQAQAAYVRATDGATAQNIASAAYQQGIDPSTALTVWSAEGGVTNPATKNPNSTATGIFQHLDSTWADLGGTDQDRLNASRQIELGVKLMKQNSDALKQDLGRQPQPWEVYLAHQQGLAGAEKLMSNPDANAASLVGEKAVTLNGGTPDMTAADFTNMIKGYVSRHTQMYDPQGMPTAQNIKENYLVHAEAIRQQAQIDHPNDPLMQDKYVQYYQTHAAAVLNAEHLQDQGDMDTVNRWLNDPRGPISFNDFMKNPDAVTAYGRLLVKNPGYFQTVTNALADNAMRTVNAPATPESEELFTSLHGMQATDRARFEALDLTHEARGQMPLSQYRQLQNEQDALKKHESTMDEKNIADQKIVRLTDRIIKEAPAGHPLHNVQSQYLLPDQAKQYNQLISNVAQQVDIWRKNNANKIPDDQIINGIIRGVVFPNQQPGSQQAQAKPESAQAVDVPEATLAEAVPQNMKAGETLIASNGVAYQKGKDGLWRGNPFDLWVASQLEAAGKLVSEDTIMAAKQIIKAKNPNIEKEYQASPLVSAQKGAQQ